MLEAIAAHNAIIAASLPAEEPLEVDHEAVKAELAGANSPEEVMAILNAHGMPNSQDGMQAYR